MEKIIKVQLKFAAISMLIIPLVFTACKGEGESGGGSSDDKEKLQGALKDQPKPLILEAEKQHALFVLAPDNYSNNNWAKEDVPFYYNGEENLEFRMEPGAASNPGEILVD